MQKTKLYAAFKYAFMPFRLNEIYKKTFSLLVSALTVCLSVLLSFSVEAQFYNERPEFLNANKHWAFGTGSGLEFSTGTAVAWTNSVTGSFSLEGYSTVSDPVTGALLFYSNGGSVWNKNHQIMPNGTGLLGNSHMGLYTSRQGTVIVPFISDDEGVMPTKYYLFSLTWGARRDTNPVTGERGSLFYNVIDMSLESGMGDVDTALKNIVLDTSILSEAMIAIPGCHNDIWVLVHSSYQSDPVYKAFHITEDGINPTPVVSPSLIRMDSVFHDAECMTVSPDRTKIAFAGPGGRSAELSHFDPATGTVSGSIDFKKFPTTDFWSNYNAYYQAAFSPDNRQLYLTTHDVNTQKGHVLQYDITVMDSTAIELSKDTVATVTGSHPFLGLAGTGLRLYNDTIYVSDFVSALTVHRINQPNNQGGACDFQLDAITLSAENPNYFLGMEVVFPIAEYSGTTVDTIICRGLDSGAILSPQHPFNGSTYIWSTGDTTAHTLAYDHGTYWVEYGDGCKFVDTIIVKPSDLFTTITINGYELGTTGGPFVTYQWYLDGERIEEAANSTLNVTQNGMYTVEVTDEYGCRFMSDPYGVTNASVDDVAGLGHRITIYPNPADDVVHISSPVAVDISLISIEGRLINTYRDAKAIPLTELSRGVYLLRIYDTKGTLIKTEKLSKL